MAKFEIGDKVLVLVSGRVICGKITALYPEMDLALVKDDETDKVWKASYEDLRIREPEEPEEPATEQITREQFINAASLVMAVLIDTIADRLFAVDDGY